MPGLPVVLCDEGMTTHPTPSLLGDNIEFLLVSRQTVGLALKAPLAGRQEEPVLCGIKLFNKMIVVVFSALHLHVLSHGLHLFILH